MGSTYQFKVRVGGLVFREGRLLLARQNDQPFWVFPGGTLEVGEGMAECLVREIKEEANLDVSIGPLLYAGDYIKQPDPALPVGHKRAKLRQTIDVFFLTYDQGGTLTMAQDENLNELMFHDLASYRQLQVQPKQVFQQVLKDWEAGLFQDATRPKKTPQVPISGAGWPAYYLGKY